MGREIDQWRFAAADYAAFSRRLTAETGELADWFRQQRFTDAAISVGYELEACLVDEQGQPGDANDRFLARLEMPQVVPELARSNIEFNGTPQQLAGDGLRRIESELQSRLERAREVAQSLGLRLLLIGVPPTLRAEALSLAHISRSNRYLAINHSLAELRGKPQVRLDIRGNQDYLGDFDSIMPESAATSFQLHLRLPPAHAVSWYNAALVASAAVLAVSANSPWLFGYDLWAETRIPVFAQSVDAGEQHYVSFGSGYLRESLYELFEQNLQEYPPLLPIQLDEPLAHLQLHNGTIWRWNRAILSTDAADPHLRLEHRSLPSGPSLIDMLGNAAFFWGLTRGLAGAELPIDFPAARGNFYRAARFGMDAGLEWGGGRQVSCTELVLDKLLPLARAGLQQLQVDSADIAYFLDIIEERVRLGRSGAGWQRAWVGRHGHNMPALVDAYLQQQWSGRPVSEWPL